MDKNRYVSMCQRAEEGDRVMVSHPNNHEDGTIISCIPLTSTLIVRTMDGYSRSWDYHDCDDISRVN